MAPLNAIGLQNKNGQELPARFLRPPLTRSRQSMDFLQMHDGAVGVLGRHLGMTLFAMVDGFFQFAHAFIEMRILDFFLSHLSMAQRFFRMTDHGIGMTHAAMFCRFFRVRNRFSNVRIPVGERRCNRQYEQRRHH